MRVLGLDVSTKTGIAIISAPCVIEYAAEIEIKKQTGLQRASSIVEKVMEAKEKYNPDFAVIEGYGYANAYTLATLVEIGTVIRYFLWQSDFPYHEVAPTQLKKFMGKGNLKKDMIRLECFKQFGFQDDSDNVVDAFVLAQMGLAASGAYPLTQLQYSAILSSSLKESEIWHPVQLKKGST